MNYESSNVGEIKLEPTAPAWVVNLVAALAAVSLDEADEHLTKLRNEICLRRVEAQIDGGAK